MLSRTDVNFYEENRNRINVSLISAVVVRAILCFIFSLGTSIQPLLPLLLCLMRPFTIELHHYAVTPFPDPYNTPAM